MAKNRVEVIIDGTVKGLTGALGKAESGLKTFGKTAGIAAAAGLAALTAVAVSTIRDLIEIEKLSAQTTAAIKSTGGAANVTTEHIASMADSMEKLTSVEAESIQQGQNMLLTFTQVQNRVGEGNDIFDQATEAMLNMSVAMGQDMQQTAVQVGKALNDPIQGVTALRRVGVQLTEQQEEQIKSFMDVNDIASAQKIILGELETQFGGSAEALGQTLGGQLEITKHKFGDLAEAAVGQLLPALGDITESAQTLFDRLADSGMLDSLFSSLGDILVVVADAAGELIEQFGPVFESVLGRIVALFGEIVGKVVDSGMLEQLAEIASILADNILSAAEEILPIVTDMLGVFLDIVTPIIQFADQMGIIKGAIYAIVASKIVGTLSAMTTHMATMLGNSAGAASAMGQMVSHAGLIGVGIAAAVPLVQNLAEEIENTNKNLEKVEEMQNEIVEGWNSITQAERESTIEHLKMKYEDVKAVFGETSAEAIALQEQITQLAQSHDSNIEAMMDFHERFGTSWENILDDAVVYGSSAFDQMLTDANEMGEDMAEGINNLNDEIANMFKNNQPKIHAIAVETAKGFVEGKMSGWLEVGPDAMDGIRGDIFNIIANPAEYQAMGKGGLHSFLMSMADRWGVDRVKIEEIEDDIMLLLGLEGQAGPIGDTTGSEYRSGITGQLSALEGDVAGFISRMIIQLGQLIAKIGSAKGAASSHTGGLVSHSGGYLSAHSGLLAPDEVMIKALKGEGIINRMATEFYGGRDFINDINSLQLGRNQTITVYNENHSDVDVDRALTQLAWRLA